MSVLRAIVALIALAVMAVGGRFVLEGLRAPGSFMLVLGAVLLIGTLFERWRYRASTAQPSSAWQRTEERFIDPESGRTLTVFYDPASGERHYVSEPADAPGSGTRRDPRRCPRCCSRP